MSEIVHYCISEMMPRTAMFFRLVVVIVAV